MSEFIISIVSEMGITMQLLCPEEQSASEKQPADPEVKEIDPPTPSTSGCAAPRQSFHAQTEARAKGETA